VPRKIKMGIREEPDASDIEMGTPVTEMAKVAEL